MTIVYELEKILTYLKKNLRILVIDGQDGIGKTTTVSPFIAEYLNASVIHLDEYLTQKKGNYFEYLDFDKLKKDIINKSGVILIEGVMALKIMQKIEQKYDQLIYVADRSWLYEWTEDEENKKMTLEEFVIKQETEVMKLQKALGEFTSYKMKEFRLEFFEYTYKFRPMDKADIIYINSK